MRIPLLKGVYTDNNSNARIEYPRNLMPVVGQVDDISEAYLRPGWGIKQFGSADGPGADRGGINWRGGCIRVMGDQLCDIDSNGGITQLGSVGDDGRPARFANSFNRLAVASDDQLWYWDGISLTKVADADLGAVHSLIWVDGYFMTTDGENIVVTELSDPTSVDPLKYGSSELDPDPINCLLKLRNEPVALNRNTIEFFRNVGGSVFPFSRINGAQIDRGTVGRTSACIYDDVIAFMGGRLNEPVSIWIGNNGQSFKIATREVDQILEGYTEAQLARSSLVPMIQRNQKHLWVQLPDRTLVYDSEASKRLKTHVWFSLTSGLGETGQYRAQNPVWCYEKWLVGDPTSSKHGYLAEDVSTHYGSDVSWQFATPILYNQANGAIIHELELVSMTGRQAAGTDPSLFTQHSLDGMEWSQEHQIFAGAQGNRRRRLSWRRQGFLRNYRVQRFRGYSDLHASFMGLEATVEPLYG